MDAYYTEKVRIIEYRFIESGAQFSSRFPVPIFT